MSAKLARLERQELAFLQGQKLAHGKLDNPQKNFGLAANEDMMANAVKMGQRRKETAVIGVETTESAEDLAMEATLGFSECAVRKRGRHPLPESDSGSDQPISEEAVVVESSDSDRKKGKRIRRNKRHQDADESVGSDAGAENGLKNQNMVKDEVKVDVCEDKRHKDKKKKKKTKKQK